jgi:ABC-type transport system involved in multi-copper enzyme maturation permease subunit
VTLYTRGYRRHEDGFQAKGFRFAPIFVEGYREAVKTKAFRRFLIFFSGLAIVFAILYYVNPTVFADRVPGSSAPATSARTDLLRKNIGSFLGTLDWLAPFLVLFVGAGLVAEDLRTRALPLYLVRPITPVDYWLGKLLIPTGVLALAMLLPCLALVLFGILLEPSETVVAFAGEQGRLLLAIVVTWLASSAAYGSLTLLLSTLTGRRTPALILGAAAIVVAPLIVGLAVDIKTRGNSNPSAAIGGPIELVKALMLPADVSSIFRAIADVPPPAGEPPVMPPPWIAFGAIVATTLLAATVVIRRARSVEVVS